MPIFSFLLRPEHHVDRKALKLKNPNFLCTFECNITTKQRRSKRWCCIFFWPYLRSLSVVGRRHRWGRWLPHTPVLHFSCKVPETHIPTHFLSYHFRVLHSHEQWSSIQPIYHSCIQFLFTINSLLAKQMQCFGKSKTRPKKKKTAKFIAGKEKKMWFWKRSIRWLSPKQFFFHTKNDCSRHTKHCHGCRFCFLLVRSCKIKMYLLLLDGWKTGKQIIRYGVDNAPDPNSNRKQSTSSSIILTENQTELRHKQPPRLIRKRWLSFEKKRCYCLLVDDRKQNTSSL